jgi:hypothetical protein
MPGASRGEKANRPYGLMVVRVHNATHLVGQVG